MRDFDAVVNGTRRRARWRSPDGWVRVERLSEDHLSLRGPCSEVRRLCAAIPPGWRCPQPLRDTDEAAAAEVLLVRKAPAPRHSRLRILAMPAPMPR
jgi:hypothetical protein